MTLQGSPLQQDSCNAHFLSGLAKTSPNWLFATKMIFPISLKSRNSGSANSPWVVLLRDSDLVKNLLIRKLVMLPIYTMLYRLPFFGNPKTVHSISPSPQEEKKRPRVLGVSPMVPSHVHVGMGQNSTTRNRAAGLSLLGFPFTRVPFWRLPGVSMTLKKWLVVTQKNGWSLTHFYFGSEGDSRSQKSATHPHAGLEYPYLRFRFGAPGFLTSTSRPRVLCSKACSSALAEARSGLPTDRRRAEARRTFPERMDTTTYHHHHHLERIEQGHQLFSVVYSYPLKLQALKLIFDRHIAHVTHKVEKSGVFKR